MENYLQEEFLTLSLQSLDSRFINMPKKSTTNSKGILKVLGPGLLFASTAIGTSHLVLSTRAGAHHGMIFFWIILGALLFKYPFFEFGPRYANATGESLLEGYKRQGKWAIILFMSIIFINMFAITGAIAAVCAGLLNSMMGLSNVGVPILFVAVLVITALILLIGKFKALEGIIKLISVVLLVTVVTAFLAVIFKGPVAPIPDFQTTSLIEGSGLALLIGLIGWMPTGMEASTMHSIWVVDKVKVSGYQPSLKEGLFDFNLGYIFTAVLAFMFLTIGAFTVYGTGQQLEGNATQFSNKLLGVFTAHLGQWSYPVIAIAAFGTIYGTLITVWDALARGCARGIRIFKFPNLSDEKKQVQFLSKWYSLFLIIIGTGGFLLFYLFASNMIQILEVATIMSFLTAPIISVLNLRAITSELISESHRPPKWMLILSYVGLVFMVAFSVYFLYDKFL